MSNQPQTQPLQEQDLTPSLQQLTAQLASLREELNSLKEQTHTQTQTLPIPPAQSSVSTPTSTPVPGDTSTRRRVLRRLAGGLLIGLAAGGAAITTSSGDSLAKTSVNPVGTNNQIGTFIVPPSKPLPTGIPAGGSLFGLISTDGSSLDVSTLPTNLNYPTGVLGYSGVIGDGVAGYASASAGYGVYGYSSATSGGYGVYGQANGIGSYAGYFFGDVHLSGTLTGGTKSFKIDHPLDPANKYLYHTSVESPDMMNIYNGNVTLDNQGEATVTMPDWFEALNSDYRYVLTSIGVASPNLHIAQEINDHKFKIGGGLPGQKVSWMVTGIRQDAYAKAFRSPVEQDKTGDEKGKYIHPELFGQAKEKAIGHPTARTR